MKRYLDQRLKMRQLRAVAAIATHGSLLGASQALGMSQPALSKTLREIEDLLGVRIFERHARGVTTNQHGRIVADAARQILNSLRELEEGFDRLDNRLAGTVIIGALPTAAAGVMPDVITRLRASHPDITIRVIEDRNDELMTLLALGDVDLIVGRLYPPGENEEHLVRTPLYEEPLSFIVGAHHPLAGKPIVTPAELEAYDIALPLASFRIYTDTMAFLSAQGVEVASAVTMTSLSLLRELLFSSELVTVLPRHMLIGDVLRGTLRVLKLDKGPKSPPVRLAGIIHRADRPLLPAARAISEVIADCCREILARTEP